MDFSKIKDMANDRMKVVQAVLFVSLGIFAYFLLVRIDIGNLYKRERSLKELNSNLNILRTLAVYKEYIKEFDGKFTLRKKGAEWLMETVSESAKKKSVLLELVKPLEGSSVFGYKKVSVLVEGEAPYHEMARFISDLENSEKYVVIEKFELRARDKTAARPAQAEFFPGMNEEKGKKEEGFTVERSAVFSLVVSAFETE